MAKSFFGLFRTSIQDEPLANPKSVSAWAANLPANDPIGGAKAVAQLLEEAGAKQQSITADRILAVLALDRLTLPLQAQLQAQYCLPGLSDEVRQNLWHTRNDLARWLAHAYERIYEGIRSQTEDPKLREQLHGILSRMFHYRGVQGQQGLFRYEQWIPARWKFLHALYKEASDQGIATVPFSLVENPQPGDRFSAEQEYLQFLLLQRINTGNLSVAQIELASQWLHDWLPSLKLAATPLEGDQHWLLDLEKADGLFAPGREQPAGDVLYLDITPLRSQLRALMTGLTGQLAPGGDKARTREIKEQLALAKRLELLWLPNAPPQVRRGDRRADQRVILVASGWTEMGIMMGGPSPWRPHEPYKYTYDDASELVALGHTQASERNRLSTQDSLHPDRLGWQVLDTSESGCRIQSMSRRAARVQIGNLLGLQVEGDSRWRIGIVRRLKRRTAEHTELGLEIIAENSLLITPAPVTVRDTDRSVNGIGATTKGKPFTALYLPPQQRAHLASVRTLVVPAAEFTPGRVLSLTMDGETCRIRLAVTIEQNKDWVWTKFEFVDAEQ